MTTQLMIGRYVKASLSYLWCSEGWIGCDRFIPTVALCAFQKCSLNLWKLFYWCTFTNYFSQKTFSSDIPLRDLNVLPLKSGNFAEVPFFNYGTCCPFWKHLVDCSEIFIRLILQRSYKENHSIIKLFITRRWWIFTCLYRKLTRTDRCLEGSDRSIDIIRRSVNETIN